MNSENLVESPKSISVIIALIAGMVVGIITAIFYGFNTETTIILSIASALAIFTIILIVSNLLINLFLAKKISPLYKTLYQVDISTSQLVENIDEGKVMGKIKTDIAAWANNKTQEIGRLKEMERYRKEFLGNVSHELKTPIFNIQGYVLTLLDGGLDDPTINKKYLERTEKSINRLIGIVDDLETISKLEAGELKLNNEKFSIVGLVEDVFEALDDRAKKKSITLSFDKDYEKPIWVNADKKKINQVIYNLVLNSINYGNMGGKTTVSFTDLENKIAVEVNDNGVGIDQKDIPRIFERFYRVDKSRSREQGGTGLGLAIVKHIIEGHKQSISVRSSLNQGTSFIFTLGRAKK
ncbi:two-component sensor histidine kinase [Tenuifilaceae bacterium CYCD]|nr:two-component sensor histidine kinase [Tenuifilaceae bacterium CYCD]